MMEVTVYVVGFSLTIIGMIAGSMYWLGGRFTDIRRRLEEIDKRFKGIDERFTQMDERFTRIDDRFKQIDERFERIDERFKQVDERFEQINERLKQIDKRFEKIDERFKEIDGRFEDMDRRFDGVDRALREMGERFDRAASSLKDATVSVNSLIVEFLGVKGLIEDKEARFLASEVRRVMELVRLNPISKEELRFVKEVLAKDVDSITIDEAERVAEIGKRWWYEDGGEVAYKLFLAGLVIKGYHISKKVREGRLEI